MQLWLSVIRNAIIGKKMLKGHYKQTTFLKKNRVSGNFYFDLNDISGIGCDIRENGITNDTLHGACFLGFLALKSNVATVDEILGDYGFVHEMIHLMCFGEEHKITQSVKNMANIADELRDRVWIVPRKQLKESLQIITGNPVEII